MNPLYVSYSYTYLMINVRICALMNIINCYTYKYIDCLIESPAFWKSNTAFTEWHHATKLFITNMNEITQDYIADERMNGAKVKRG